MISIAMATYNGERFVKEQLDSLSEQVQPPRELVICDDASTDSTVQVIKRFSEATPFPVRLFVNVHRLGWRANFLKAASLCTADYIAFCDQDDIWLKDKLLTVVRYIKETQATLFLHGYRLIDDEGKVISGDLNDADDNRGAPWRINYGLTQVFHRSLLEYSDLWELSEDHFVDNERMGHDQWVSFLSSILGKTITIRDVLSLYRQHRNNTIGFKCADRKINFKGTLLANAPRFYDRGVEFKERRDDVIWIIRHRAAAASARAKIIKEIMLRDEIQANGLRLHLQYYRQMETYWSDRLSVYVLVTRRKRLDAMLSVFLQGLYQAQGKQGIRDAVVDLLYGVMY